MRQYHTLVIKEDGVWAPQFGDYSKPVVVQERKDSYPRTTWKIITTGETQSAINTAIEELNNGPR